MKNGTYVVQSFVLIAFVASFASCAFLSGRETAGEYIDDATITSKVKTDIFLDAKLKTLQINVETMQGVVQLSGFVDSGESETKALNIARHVYGVESVKDALIIRE